jgi:phosphonate transport system substrate-binding protein
MFKNKKLTALLTGTVLCASLVGCSQSSSSNSAQSAGNNVKEPDTITIAWLPNNSGDNAKQFRAEFDKVIADATGKKVEDKLTTDYNIAIAALESGDAQLGYFGPYEYLTSHAKDPKIVPLVVESGDSGTLKDALYHSRLLVNKDDVDQYKSGSSYSIDKIAGKKISFVSTSSTSGFNMPASAILGTLNKQDKWKNLTKEGLMQGGSDKLFSQVMFSGSHQLSLVNLLNGKVDISAVDDIDVASYVDLTSGKDQQEGAVYTVKKDAAAPFNTLAGKQYTIIKSIPVQNTPLEANSSVLNQKTLDAITKALTSDKVTNDTTIFAQKGTPGSMFVQPHKFLKVDDSWYDPMKKVLGLEQ